jgi:hypothetical protein
MIPSPHLYDCRQHDRKECPLYVARTEIRRRSVNRSVLFRSESVSKTSFPRGDAGTAVAIAAVIHRRSQARDTRIILRENRTSHTVSRRRPGSIPPMGTGLHRCDEGRTSTAPAPSAGAARRTRGSAYDGPASETLHQSGRSFSPSTIACDAPRRSAVLDVRVDIGYAIWHLDHADRKGSRKSDRRAY